MGQEAVESLWDWAAVTAEWQAVGADGGTAWSPPAWVLGGRCGLHATLGRGVVELCAIVITGSAHLPLKLL